MKIWLSKTKIRFNKEKYRLCAGKVGIWDRKFKHGENLRHQNAEVGVSEAKVGLTKKKSDIGLSKKSDYQ